MRRRRVAALTFMAVVCVLVAACSGGSSGGTAPSTAPAYTGTIGVILPDSSSSARWETADRVFLSHAFDAAGVSYDIENAKGDRNKFLAIGDKMIAASVKVLVLVNLDSPTADEVIKRAARAGIPVIDYDRISLGGGAKYYVSFDNVAVGAAIGQGLVRGLKAAGKTTGRVLELDGSPTDNNATLVKQGYDKVIKDAGYTVVGSDAVPDWDAVKAVGVFKKLLDKAGGTIDGVAAANDGLGGAAASVLAEKGLAGKVPVTGQDATDEALQRLLLGTQYVSVYKAIKLEADAAAKLAILLIKGDLDGADALASKSVEDPQTHVFAKAVLLTPRPIYKETVLDVLADGFTTAAKICVNAQLKAACSEAHITP